MRLALERPSTILVVTSDAEGDAVLVRAARACDGADVAVVESLAAARDRVDGDDVACIAVGDVDGDVAEFVSEVALDVPVLYCPATADDSAVGAAAAAGARYLPRADDVADRLAEALDGALADYQERWRWAEESEILNTMLSELDVALFAKDEQARHVKVADVKGGYPPEKQYGKTDREMFPEDHPFSADETYRDDLQVIETGEPIRKKLHRHGDESPLWMRETKVPRRDEDGSIVGLVGVAVNVTQMQEQVRTLKRRVERLENFVSRAHHDLKNPLQVASGHLRLARRDRDDDGHLADVEAALGRMEEMLDDLKQMSQGAAMLDSGIETAPFSEIVDAVWDAIGAESATLDVAFPEDAVIGAPESDVRPLFENLLKNAVVHGGEDVTVTVGRLPSGFYVADDGRGIPADERDRVTQEGYTTSESGSGSGLAIVSDIATENEWDLTVTESESGGARFEFRNVMLVGDRPETTVGASTYELDEAVDVGSVTAGDRGTYDAELDRWTVEADGNNIWRYENDFHYVFTRVSGDVRIEGRVRDVEPVHELSKAGFMFRGGTDEESAYCHLGATALRGSEVLWRGRAGDAGQVRQLGDGTGRFEHYQLDRVGDTVTCSVSEVGDDWKAVDQRQVDFDDPILVGIAVCSLAPRYPTTAVVENVSVTSLSARSDE